MLCPERPPFLCHQRHSSGTSQQAWSGRRLHSEEYRLPLAPLLVQLLMQLLMQQAMWTCLCLTLLPKTRAPRNLLLPWRLDERQRRASVEPTVRLRRRQE